MTRLVGPLECSFQHLSRQAFDIPYSHNITGLLLIITIFYTPAVTAMTELLVADDLPLGARWAR